MTGQYVSDKATLRIAGLLFCLACIPVFLVELPPIADLPNHLARAHILRDGGENYWLAQYYAENWAVLPNLLMDIIIVGMSNLSLFSAGKLIVILSFFLIVGGVFLVRRTLFSSVGVLSLLVFLMLYNRMLLWGMVNYVMGIGMMLIAFGLWVRYREQGPVKLVAISTVMASLVFLTHLFPFGLYALCIGAYELQRVIERDYRKWQNWFEPVKLGGWQFIMPVYAFLFLSPTSEFVQNSRLEFGDPVRKLTNIPFMAFNNYNLPLDAATLVMTGGVCVFFLWRGYLRINRQMYAVLGLLLTLHFVTPQYILSSPGADLRTFLPFLFLFIASVQLHTLKKAHVVKAVIGLCILFCIRLAVVGWHWYQADRTVLVEYNKLIERLPEGAKVGSYYLVRPDRWFFNPPHNHYITLAIIDKSVLSFNLFTHPGQQPVRLQAAWYDLKKIAPQEELETPKGEVLAEPLLAGSAFFVCRFSQIEWFVLSNRGSATFNTPEFLRLEYTSQSVDLYKVDHAVLENMSVGLCP